MKRPLRIKFVDHEWDFDFQNQLICRAIRKNYEILRVDRDPDYVISFGLGLDHTRYHDCVKILWTGENCVPDFNWFDYAIGFDHLSFGDRYLRMPLYGFCTRDLNRLLANEIAEKSREELLNRGFCSFVVSNGAGDPMRRRFFERLSQYKKVDSGGGFLNNVGGRVANKGEFCRKYKFHIAFENSVYPGYVTEKILQAYAAFAVPIYYGDPTIETDFNRSSMVFVSGEDDIERAVEEVISLDRDDDAYLSRLRSPALVPGIAEGYERQLEDFFSHIFEQDVTTARRRSRYGYQATQAHRLAPVLLGYQAARKAAWKCLSALHIK